MKKPTIEPMKQKNPGSAYVAWLHDWILENSASYFCNENKADSYLDFCRFPTADSDRVHLCLPNEPFLVDRDIDGVHMYCICTLSEKGKVTSEIPVIDIAKITRSHWRNGYFLLPSI